MTAKTSRTGNKPPVILGPYSRSLRRGAIGSSLDGRSTMGRFVRDLEKQLIDHVGGNPSITQRLLIERMIKVRIQLDLLDEKLASGEWTPHDSRTYGGLLNAYRLTAREIGMKPTSATGPAPDLTSYLVQKAAQKTQEGN